MNPFIFLVPMLAGGLLLGILTSQDLDYYEQQAEDYKEIIEMQREQAALREVREACIQSPQSCEGEP